MVGICVLLVLMLAAGCTGIYLVIKKYCWRETLGYVPVICSAVFAISCTVIMMLSISSMNRGSYDKGYAEGMAYGKAEGRSEAQYQVTESTQDIDVEEIYASAYERAFRELAGILGEMLSREVAVENTDEELKLIIDNEEQSSDEPTRSEMPNDEEKTSDNSSAPTKGTTVYYTKNGSVIHKDRNCRYLKNASDVLSADISEAPNRKLCSACGG